MEGGWVDGIVGEGANGASGRIFATEISGTTVYCENVDVPM